jgi:DNA polymerase-3 subunit delta
MDALAFVEQVDRLKPKPLYAVFGDEDFLRRRVLIALRRLILDSEENTFSLSVYAGDTASFAGVRDELDTLPFLAPRRLVVIDDADPFVSNFRPQLEKYAGSPSPTGALVLNVKTWPSTTRLAKLLEGDATIQCKALPAQRLPEWCVRWAKAHHGRKLSRAAASLLLDLVGPEMGLLDLELAKLATYVGSAGEIKAEDVDKLVGSSRAETIWKIFDATGSGRTNDALAILDRLLEQGEDPIRTLGAFSKELRGLAQVARRTARGQSLGAAMEEAGVPFFAKQRLEQQLRRLGRQCDRLYDWLLEVDMGLKGFSQLPARTLLERLVIRLAT